MVHPNNFLKTIMYVKSNEVDEHVKMVMSKTMLNQLMLRWMLNRLLLRQLFVKNLQLKKSLLSMKYAPTDLHNGFQTQVLCCN